MGGAYRHVNHPVFSHFLNGCGHQRLLHLEVGLVQYPPHLTNESLSLIQSQLVVLVATSAGRNVIPAPPSLLLLLILTSSPLPSLLLLSFLCHFTCIPPSLPISPSCTPFTLPSFSSAFSQSHSFHFLPPHPPPSLPDSLATAINPACLSEEHGSIQSTPHCTDDFTHPTSTLHTNLHR